MRRFLLSFLCLMMAFGLYGEGNDRELTKDSLHYLVEKNENWCDFKSEISIYSDSQVLMRTCCQLLGIDEQQTLQEYIEELLNSFDSRVPYSEKLYNHLKRERFLRHYHIMICPKGEAVGDYQTFELYYQRTGTKTKRILQRTFVYDQKNDKVLTVDDIFVPDVSEDIKSRTNNQYISLYVQKTQILCGISPANGKISFGSNDYIQNEKNFTETFKQAIAFDELRAEAEKQRQQKLREQQRKDSLRIDSLQKAREEYLARTAYKRISNDFGELMVSEYVHKDTTGLHLSWAKAEQPSTINIGAGNYTLVSLKNTNGTTDSLWVEYLTPPLNKQRLGVNERMSNGKTRTETTTVLRNYYPIRSYESGRWTTFFNIDKPANNPAFEQCLCKLIFNKSGKQLEDAGEKFVKSFKGKKIGKAKAHAVLIMGDSRSYNPGKYYSYAYNYTYFPYSRSFLDIIFSPGIGQPVVKNIIYDIQNQKVLSLSDVLTTEEIAHLGLNKKTKADLALDNYYLYVGIEGKPLCTYAICRENWNKFTDVLQNLIAPYDSLPAKIDSTFFVFKDYVGIQPASISYKIKQEPLFRDHADSLLVYLKSHLALPDSMKNDNSWKIQFVVGKDGQLSHVETTPEKNGDGYESFAAKLTETLEQMPAWQPLDIAGLGMQNSLLTYNVKFVTHPTLGDDPIYDLVETNAQFPGGDEECIKWLSEHIQYPALCMEQGIQGRVIVKFVVNLDGSISDVETIRSPHPLLSKEAERVVKEMPKWTPAIIRGIPVRARFYQPVMFKINQTKRH